VTICKLDSVLINVPLSSPLHPKANMPFLKGYIAQKGYASRVFDTNISFFHWMLKGREFDIHDQSYIDNPVSLLALYNKIEDWLAEECKKYTGLRVDLRTIGFAYNRTCFSEVLKAIKDPDANPMIAFYNQFIDNELKALNPEIVCVGVTFQDNIIAAFTLADRVREKMPDAKMVFGGQMITRCYDTMLADGSLNHLWDYLALWDGEIPLLDIHDHIINGSTNPMRNVVSQEDDKSKNMIGREVVSFDLNETTLPDFDDIDLDSYLFPEMLIPLQTARGCYGACDFCAIPSGSNDGFRERSVEKIITDIRYVQELTERKYFKKATYFKFMDDTTSPRTLFGIARQIIDKGIDAKWETYVRMEMPFQNEEKMKLLYAGGCRKLMWGLETNDPEILKNMNKKVDAVSPSKVLEASFNAGILNFAFVLIGFPGEVDSQREQLIEFIARTKAINVLTVSTFDVTKASPMQSSLMENNPWNLECDDPEGFEVRLVYTINGENWKKKIVKYAQKFMLDVSKMRPDVALVSLFPDQVRGILTEKHDNKWGSTFLNDFGEENIRKMLQATEEYIDAFESTGSDEIELSYLPDPIKREHFRTKNDIDAISRAIARRKSYEAERSDSI
jgi:radical SAM superfamily enzyme YgiQ (UPF0313 family)